MGDRLTYEHFLKKLGGKYYNKVDGNKYTLQTMRNLLFEKRNCSIEQNHSGNFILAFLEGEANGIEDDISSMLMSLKEKNKVLWWKNRSIYLRTKNQYH